MFSNPVYWLFMAAVHDRLTAKWLLEPECMPQALQAASSEARIAFGCA